MTGEKAVADPVHGTIPLSQLEAQIISTRAFQRLRNVKQLGLAHMVYPGADYSRFSHSVGVCHVAGRILDALEANKPGTVSARERECYRLAGLLHDVGHYPFSHTAENTLKAYFSSQFVESAAAPIENSAAKKEVGAKYFVHEKVGELILQEDPEIRKLLDSAGYAPKEVSAIFTHEQPDPKLSNLISSDLDADRIDYLLRTERHTGLPYGSIDLEYLLTQFSLDNEGLLCVNPKALRAVEHFLLARYFDYQQVSYHKTVAGLELVLMDVLRELLESGRMDGSASAVRKQIADGTWASFDDSDVLQRIRRLAEETKNEVVREKAKVLLNRRPPKLVASAEHFATRDDDTLGVWAKNKTQVEKRIKQWSEKFGIAEGMWYVWQRSDLGLTRIPSKIDVAALDKAASLSEEAEQVARILKPDGSSVEIFKVRRSLMSVLANQALYALRVYAILPEETATETRVQIGKQIKEDLDGIDWT